MIWFKRFIIILTVGVVLCAFSFSCFAEVYESNFPSYCNNSGGAWAEVATQQGRATVVVGRDYISDVFSFYGSEGYNILNSTSNTVNGYIYFQRATSYYTNPTVLQCRFSAMNTLEVYEPYQTSNYGGSYTSYRWTSLSTTQIYNTNIGFVDYASDRQNNDFIYSLPEKLQIIIILLIVCILFYFLLGRSWRA